jgi:ABC-type cobalamin transport system ATPase subunit
MKKLLVAFVLTLSFCMLFTGKVEARKLNMVFVPASEKSEAGEFKSLMDIVTKLTGIKFNFIKITDYNAAVEAMRAGRADIAWFGAATYVIAAEIANAEAFAAGIPKGQKDAGYYTYFVVRKESPIKTLADAKGKVLALNHIGSTSGVQLLEKAYDLAGDLSGGQKQRVGIERAIMQKPSVILADEPISNLDPMIAYDILNLLKDISIKDGIPIICNLHQVDFALQFADRIICLVDGQNILEKPAAELNSKMIFEAYKGRNEGMFFGES